VSPIDPGTLRSLHLKMTTIRMFERRMAREFRRGDMPGFVHSYAGEEAVAAGVCAHLTDEDVIASTHRGHGHCIAKGCSLRGMFAELYGRTTGLCQGRGGSMHIADFARGMLGANAIVGGGISLATGGALAAQVRGTDRVAVSFFGDGAANQGILYECLNYAALWKLPVIYVCENNAWAESTPADYSIGDRTLVDRAAAYRMPAVRVDAEDVRAVYTVAGEAVARARAGEGPSFIEVKTYRIDGHFVGDPDDYRSDAERAEAERHDPLHRLRAELLDAGLLEAADVELLEKEIADELDAAVEHAKSSPLPDPEDITKNVYADGGSDRA
jgi:acetoin:2,6-dichlorophenolindophenol oxidoreductase subunit alpha